MFYFSLAKDKCFEGFYFDENKKCQFCSSGYYCPDGINKIECPNGTYSHEREETTECKKCGCEGCLKRNIVNETTKEKIKYAGSCAVDGTCYPGFGMDETKLICELCEPGHFSIGGAMYCLLCPMNTYNTKYGETRCYECPMNQGATDGHTRCEICPPGRFYNKKDGSCSLCLDNNVSETEGQTECKYCGEDMHANEDNTKCLPGPMIREKYIVFA